MKISSQEMNIYDSNFQITLTISRRDIFSGLVLLCKFHYIGMNN